MRVKIIGAGSAGMHHAHAARALGWKVEMVDTDPGVTQWFPQRYALRYGEWDAAIRFECGCEHDLVIIATPPASHVELALQQQGPVLIEKPLCAPGQEEEAKKLLGRQVYVGYLHCLAFPHIGHDLLWLAVDWCEHYDHILKAHPWLTSVRDSYLGEASLGGGALYEHSHGINLWQHIARLGGHGEVKVTHGSYLGSWSHCNAILATETGFVGRVSQNMATDPPQKRAIINGPKGRIVEFGERLFTKQLEHIATTKAEDSPIGIQHGIRTAFVLADLYFRPCQ